MTDLETLLSATLRERAADAPQPLALAAGARHTARTIRRRRWLAVAASAAAVVVVVAGTTLALGRRSSPEPAGPVPAGWRPVSSLGIQIAVPGSWHVVSDVTCARYLGPSVVRGGGPRTDCLRGQSATETVVTLARAPNEPTTPSGISGGVAIGLGHVDERLTLGGVPAELERTRLPDGRHVVILLVRSRDVVVDAVGPDAALLERVVRTARLVDVDWAGCTTRLPARPSWDAPRSGPTVDTGTPTSVSVCSYDVDRMGASTRLTGAAAAELVAAIRAAKPGPVTTQVFCPAPVGDPNPVLMTLHRAGAPDLQLRMHYDVCALGAYVASPSGVSQVTQRLLAAVFHPLAQGYGFSNPLPKG